MNFNDPEDLEKAGFEYASGMAIAHKDVEGHWYGLAGVFVTFAYGLLMLLTRINMTQIETMKRKEPRWVNIGDNGSTCLVDANEVVAVYSREISGRTCTFVKFRGVGKPLRSFDYDHDEVRCRLGIDEDWIGKSPESKWGRFVRHAYYDELMAIVDAARKVVNDRRKGAVKTNNVDTLEELIDSHDSIPF